MSFDVTIVRHASIKYQYQVISNNNHVTPQDDPTKQSRVEDEIIAYLWRSFIEKEKVSAEILLRYPMTKVKAIICLIYVNLFILLA